MVPAALQTNLNCIAPKLIDLAAQLVHHAFWIYHPARKTAQLLAINVPNLAQRVPLAYGTGAVKGLTYMPSSPHQLGMGIANVKAIDGSLTKAPQK